MTANRLITIRLKGRTFSMRPGKPVPAVVAAHWSKTGELERMIEQKIISDASTVTAKPRATKAEVQE